jgi:glycosyltransferase involved in cell wall biosynthesis
VGPAYPLRGGIAQFNAILVQTLRRRGHEVNVISFRRQYPGLLFPGRTQREEGQIPPELDVGAEAVLDTVAPWTWWVAYRKIRAQDPDLVLYKYWMPFFAPCFGTLSRWIHKGTHAKVLYICDNVVPHERRILDDALTRYLLESGDAFIVMSRTVRDDLLRFRPGARHRLVPHPVYEHFGRPMDRAQARRRLLELGVRLADPDSGRPLLLFFGIIRPYKGLDLLLRAMPGIVRETQAALVVAGEFYSGREETYRLVEELELREHVHLVDAYVPNDQVGIYLSAADVVVLPYRSATQSGIVQVAYQLERPVIATDVGGLSEMIRDGETGLLVPPGDVEALEAAVIRFLREGMGPAMEERVREEKKRFSWDRMAEAVEELAAEGS